MLPCPFSPGRVSGRTEDCSGHGCDLSTEILRAVLRVSITARKISARRRIGTPNGYQINSQRIAGGGEEKRARSCRHCTRQSLLKPGRPAKISAAMRSSGSHSAPSMGQASMGIVSPSFSAATRAGLCCLTVHRR